MANQEHLAILKQGVDTWNEWIEAEWKKDKDFQPDLSGADLHGWDLSGAQLRGANLSGTDLSYANLEGTYLFDANLSGADITGARFSKGNPQDAIDRGAEEYSVLEIAKKTLKNMPENIRQKIHQLERTSIRKLQHKDQPPPEV